MFKALIICAIGAGFAGYQATITDLKEQEYYVAYMDCRMELDISECSKIIEAGVQNAGQ